MGNVSQSLRESRLATQKINSTQIRYRTTFEDAVDEMSIAQKKEMHRDLQHQALLLLQLESEILRILRKLSEEEANLRRREKFLELRRRAYVKRLDTASVEEQKKKREEEEEEEEEEEVDGESKTNNYTIDARVADIVLTGDGSGQLETITVVDASREEKEQELMSFLQEELPQIQREVALSAQSLWFKREGYQDQLADTRKKLSEVKTLIEGLECGMPSVPSFAPAQVSQHVGAGRQTVDHHTATPKN